MITTISPYQLGATLYIPATRNDIASIIINNKIAGLRSLVICLEDAVSEADVDIALANLHDLLNTLARAKATSKTQYWPLLFIRPRHPQMAKKLVTSYELTAIDGFVLPKFTQNSLEQWWDILQSTHLSWMPTLETEEVFDVTLMRELATCLRSHPCHKRIIALRIGGNDLMNVIALRRPREFTLYDGPMGYVIKMLVSVFSTRGFFLTSPVCEHIDDHSLMDKELSLDIAHGLVGKTAIHPNQINKIQHALMVSSADYTDALRIINANQAVFKSQGAMCEPATHRKWAASILERAKYYGIADNDFNDNSYYNKIHYQN